MKQSQFVLILVLCCLAYCLGDQQRIRGRRRLVKSPEAKATTALKGEPTVKEDKKMPGYKKEDKKKVGSKKQKDSKKKKKDSKKKKCKKRPKANKLPKSSRDTATVDSDTKNGAELEVTLPMVVGAQRAKDEAPEVELSEPENASIFNTTTNSSMAALPTETSYVTARASAEIAQNESVAFTARSSTRNETSSEGTDDAIPYCNDDELDGTRDSPEIVRQRRKMAPALLSVASLGLVLFAGVAGYKKLQEQNLLPGMGPRTAKIYG